MNTGVHVSFKLVFWFFLDILPEEKFLGYMVVEVLVFWETSIMFSIMVAPIYIPTCSVKGSLFSTPLPTFVVCRRLSELSKLVLERFLQKKKIRDKKTTAIFNRLFER